MSCSRQRQQTSGWLEAGIYEQNDAAKLVLDDR
jgi:hypothetical protein